jgi:hypothetical protein
MWFLYYSAQIAQVLYLPALACMLLWWKRERRLRQRLKAKKITMADFASHSLVALRRRKEYWGLITVLIAGLYSLSVSCIALTLQFLSLSSATQLFIALSSILLALSVCLKGWKHVSKNLLSTVYG